MFGHNDQHDDNQASTAPEPVDDGTLGVPPPDDGNNPTAAPVHGDNHNDPGALMMLPAQQTIPPTDLPTPTHSAHSGPADDLISIKQDALQQLKPLVGHLEQTPEEKFRTTMMMIQAADDQSLINDAYEAAKAIADEKVRAQALLDVVNEINYFTTQKG